MLGLVHDVEEVKRHHASNEEQGPVEHLNKLRVFKPQVGGKDRHPQQKPAVVAATPLDCVLVLMLAQIYMQLSLHRSAAF